MDSGYDEIFRLTPEWLVCALLLIGLLLSAELGFRIARRMREKASSSAGSPSDLQPLQAAVLGILGLLLGFTYSFVATRYEERKHAVIDEANAIGTSYLRAELIPSPISSRLQSVLRQYLDTRILPDDVAQDPKRLRAAIEKSEQVQARIWPLVKQQVESRATDPIDRLLVDSLNQVIDQHAIRLAAARDHVPPVVYWLLFFLAAVVMGLGGFSAGIAASRHLGRNCTIAVMIAVTVLMILDLDQPRGGWVRVSQQSLIDLQQQLHEGGLPQATEPDR